MVRIGQRLIQLIGFYCFLANLGYTAVPFSLQYSGTIPGSGPGDFFGKVICNAGDLNHDGYDDLILTQPVLTESDGTRARGDRVLVFHGGPDFDAMPDLIFHAKATNMLGKVDFNQDGAADLVIADEYASPGGTIVAGQVRLYFGTPTGLDTLPRITLNGTYFYSSLGESMAAGDVNGDGYPDLVVAAPHDNYREIGRVSIYCGGDPMDATRDWYFQPDPTDTTTWLGQYGESVACGDLNNDEYADFAIGAPYNGNDVQPSRIYLYQGTDHLSTVPVATVYGDSLNDYLGRKSLYIPPQSPTTYGSILSGWTKQDTLPFGVSLKQIGGSSNLTGFMIDTVPNPTVLDDSLDPGSQIFFHNEGFGDFNGDGIRDFFTTGHYYGRSQSYDVYDSGRPDVFLYSGPLNLAHPDTTFRYHDIISAMAFVPIVAMDLNGDGLSEILFNRIVNPTGDWHDWEFFLDIYSAQPFPITRTVPEPSAPLPSHPQLYPAYPNPFNSSTTIRYDLPEDADLTLRVYNLRGELVKTLYHGSQTAGYHQVLWDGTNQYNTPVSSGMYLCWMQSKAYGKTMKMMLVR